MDADPEGVSARRLTLTVDEWACLRRVSGADSVPVFADRVRNSAEHAISDAVAFALADRGVLTRDDDGGWVPVRAVAANIAVLAYPTALVDLDISANRHRERHVIACAGHLGASLLRLADGGVELSLFPAMALGHSLLRTVPPLGSAAFTAFASALSPTRSDDGPADRSWGRVPLEAVATCGIVGPSTPEPGTDIGHLTADVAAVLHRLATTATGVLRASVIAPTRGLAHIVWVSTTTGWVGLRPVTAPLSAYPEGSSGLGVASAVRMVDLVPVDRADFASWLAPYLATILEGADERP